MEQGCGDITHSWGRESGDGEWPFGASLQEWQTANLSMKTAPEAHILKTSKMKVDSDELLKTKGKFIDKKSDADELLKTNGLVKTPMSYSKQKR